jgi:hypothetical protein
MTTPKDVWAVLDPLTGMGEIPDGSNNAPPITDWYYGWHAAWCAMTESYGLAKAGFSDDGGETLNLSRIMPGFVQTTPKGFAYVPYLEDAYRAVGRFDGTPREGDLGITAGQEHTFFVWRVNDDGTVNTLEGNYGNHLVLGRRSIASIRGFCHPPYDAIGTPDNPPPLDQPSIPDFPGFLRRGSRGNGVRLLQQRLSDRGWTIGVDGDFGPQTFHVVTQFQADKGLETDGVVGPITWSALWTEPIT